MAKILKKVVGFLQYDAEREFYAKVFPESFDQEDLVRFRKIQHEDIPAIREIEKQVYNFPWDVGVFKDCLKAGYACWICEGVGVVIGYCIVSVAVGEAHILNISVDPKFQGKGYGKKLMEHLIEVVAEKNAETIFLEVRPSNQAAVKLYEKLGFNEIGVRKDYYPAPDGREDALMLAKEILK